MVVLGERAVSCKRAIPVHVTEAVSYKRGTPVQVCAITSLTVLKMVRYGMEFMTEAISALVPLKVLQLNHMQTLLLSNLGFNQNYCTFTFILLNDIVLCGRFA